MGKRTEETCRFLPHPRFAPAAPADDRGRRAPRRRVGGCGLVRHQRPAGRLLRNARAHPRRRARAGLATVGERTGADGGAHARDRARAGARRRPARGRLVLRALPVRDRAGADRRRLRAAAAARAPGGVGARCPPTSGSPRPGASTASCSPTSRPAIRASTCSSSPASPSCWRAGPAGPCPFPWVETRHDEGMAPLVDHLVGLGHERIGFLAGRPGVSTSVCASWPGARR